MADVEAEGHYGVRVGFSVDSRNWVLGKYHDPLNFPAVCCMSFHIPGI